MTRKMDNFSARSVVDAKFVISGQELQEISMMLRDYANICATVANHDDNVLTRSSAVAKEESATELVEKLYWRPVDYTGKIVKFTGRNGNEFRDGDIAVCIDSKAMKFLGLSGSHFMQIKFETMPFETLEDNSPDLETLLSEPRMIYNMYHEA